MDDNKELVYDSITGHRFRIDLTELQEYANAVSKLRNKYKQERIEHDLNRPFLVAYYEIFGIRNPNQYWYR